VVREFVSASAVREEKQNNMKSFKEYINEAHDIEDMASGVHDEWMRRNPKADYNAAQHVSYSDLPDQEKEKDREHINLAFKLRQDNPRDPETDVKDHEERLAQRFGAIQHKAWRKGHESAKGVGAPRMKKVSDGPDVDINVPWEQLHSEWKRENLEAGRAAVGITGILKPREMNEITLLEFDPNRGAPGRAVSQGQQARKDLGIKNKTSERQTRFKGLSPHNQDRVRAFDAGKYGKRWQGSLNDRSTPKERAETDSAHQAGKPIDLSRIWGRGEERLVAGTPAHILQQKIANQREMNEAKLEFKRKAFDADKLFGAGGKFDPADPSAPKERSFVTPKEPSAAQRLAAAKKPKKIKKPKNLNKKGETWAEKYREVDPRYPSPNGKFYKSDSPLHSSKDAHTESATETPDGDIMSFHNELLRHVATRKNRMVPLHILSRRIPDSVGTEFTIHTSKNGDAIHTYFHPDGGHYDDEPAGHFANPVIDEDSEERPGHRSHPDAPFRITHLSAENLINDHRNNTIRNGKSKGKSVSEHHGIDED